jgi:hypothetical protein
MNFQICASLLPKPIMPEDLVESTKAQISFGCAAASEFGLLSKHQILISSL